MSSNHPLSTGAAFAPVAPKSKIMLVDDYNTKVMDSHITTSHEFLLKARHQASLLKDEQKIGKIDYALEILRGLY